MPDEVVNLPSQEPMLKAVGRGIQAFAHVEMALGYVFSFIMHPANHRLSVITLEAARHIEAKLRIVRAVADAKLNSTDLEAVHNLLNRVKNKADFRHKLAHWEVSYWPGAKSADEVKRQKVALVPPFHSEANIRLMWKPKETDAKPLFETDVQKFVVACGELTGELLGFVQRTPSKDSF